MASTPSAARSRPRHHLEYAGLLALRELLGRPPSALSLALGAGLGRALGGVLRNRWRVGAINLAIAFPELSEDERRRILRESFRNLGRGAAEWMQIAAGREAVLDERIVVEGLEHVEEARRRSPRGGAIALSAHLGNWELAAAVVARSVPLTMVYRTFSNPHLERWVSRWRTARGIEVRPLGTAARGALRALAEGRLVVMTLDQNARRNEGVFVPFFGKPACTRTGPARVAMRTGAPVLPVFDLRRGNAHVVRFHPALDLEPGPSPRDGEAYREAVRRNTLLMTRAVEEAVRGAPEGWIWTHRRWKTRPAGEPRRYPSRRGRREGRGRRGRTRPLPTQDSLSAGR